MHRPSRRGRAGAIVAVVLLAAAVVGAFVLFSGRRPGEPSRSGGSERDLSADQLARELAAAYFADDDRGKAAAAIAPLVERPDALAEDLVSAAAIELRTANVDAARGYLERALALAPDSPRVRFNLGRLERWNANYAGAVAHLERVCAALPEDVPALLMLGDTYENLDRPAEARKVYEQVLARGVELNGAWQLTALYRLSLMARDEGQDEQAARFRSGFEELQGRGMSPPDGTQLDIGVLGGIPSPAPRGTVPSGTGRLPEPRTPATAFPVLAGSTGALVADMDNNGRLDVLGWGPQGISVAFNYESGWEEARIHDGPVAEARAFDFGNDDDLDLLIWNGAQLELLVADAEDAPSGYVWALGPRTFAPLSAPLLEVATVDYDHEGDLDLLLIGDFGARLLRNDGAAGEEGAFTDVTVEAGLGSIARAAWCVVEDFDTDQDVDLLIGPELFLASNLRGGRFEDLAAERLSAAPAWSRRPLAADLDGDARPDLLADAAADGSGGLALWMNSASARFALAGAARGVPGSSADALAHDFDLDGALDLLWNTDTGLAGLLAVGLEAERPFEFPLAAGSLRALADFEGDRAWDLVLLDETVSALPTQAQNNGLRLGFRGLKDNRRGFGAVVELRSGELYRRIFWRGEAELVGVGEHTEVDLVRVTWPNGVVQYDDRRELVDRAATGDTLGFLQSEGLQGSCPFLYTWNGETFEFISDVLGTTPLGLPIAPGVLVPPDHDEYVLVLGEQLREREGFLELQFTEELREVTYLDRLRLDVVDHAAESEIYPDERFTFPPFPEPHTHTVVAPLAPLTALDGNGVDWAEELALIDSVHAVPFGSERPAIQGIAGPHFLELAFDPARLAEATKLRLIMTGWLWWSNASANMAIARDPRYDFIPPLLQVPDGAGGWRDTGPPVGFPAGKTKSMVIDVSALLDRADPRVRIFSTLRLYWDSIRLATDDDQSELRLTALEPASARLWRRGFSAPEVHERPHMPETFEWERVSAIPRWNPHPGLYTRLGEVLPLVETIDDRFVIMASGDALHVRFDARELPPVPEGWRRDYLVFLDGWAKDRDPNTLEALNVEPLPFHGMSGYPYSADESFPDTPEHRAWRREWNTRLSEHWLPRVAGTGPNGL